MKRIYIITVILASVALAWVMPGLYKIITDEAPEYPLAFYSSVDDKFCVFDFGEKGLLRRDLNGNEYSQKEFDSLLPMIYANQLIYDSRLPKKIKGVDISINAIRYDNFSYRYKPKTYNKPSIKLYPLFESMSARVDIATPSDVFRITDKIEFIDIEKNTIDVDKSTKYNKVFSNTNFKFPAKRICGIPSSRKNYDEGYFVIDSNNALFHIKRVNEKPFIRNVCIDKNIKVDFFEAIDIPNRKYYGFLFDTKGQMYVLTTENYRLIKVGIPPITMNNTTISIMANMFYWNINVKSKDIKKTYAVDAKTKKYVDLLISDNTNRSELFIKNIMPFTISFSSLYDGYVKFRLKTNLPMALMFNLLFVCTYLCIFRKNKFKFFPVFWIVVTGIYGFIACILFKSDINN
jgi:hypothetical protein